MHTSRGLAATLPYLEDTGVGTRTWMLGPRADVGGFGWAHMRDDGGENDGELAEARSGREREVDPEVVGVG
jgi:hypothetical protein